jgi:hypothetical protein
MLESRAMENDRSPGSLGALGRESAALFRETAAQAAAVLLPALLAGTVLAAAAFLFTGLLSREALNAAISDGQWLRAAPILAAGLLKRLLASLAFVALVFAVEARHAGRPLSTREAYGLAVERFIPFLYTAALAVLRIFGGLLLFVIPGIVLALRYTLAHLAVLLEELRGKPALERSAALVRAEPARALGYLAAATLVAIALNFLCALAVTVFTGLTAALGAGSVGVIQGQFEALLAEFLESMVGAWLVGFSILLYRDLVSRHPLAEN